MRDFDAVIVGAGPAGASAAILLARRGWNVAVIEDKPFPRRKVCGEYLSATNADLLASLGVKDAFDEEAGPAVTDVGLFSGETRLVAPLPRPSGVAWGRALLRERLDTLLLGRAEREGATVLQPYRATGLTREGPRLCCVAQARGEDTSLLLRAPVLIAAHGSWERRSFPTQNEPFPRDGARLFGFKAHFEASSLPLGLMPLLAFPGGYGGMVATDRGRVSLSCCIRADRLDRLGSVPGKAAGDRVLEHISEHCAGVRDVLHGARRQGDWLAAGPLRTGIHLTAPAGVFKIGNAAGEAHPVIAEGITMALQGQLLVERLDRWRGAGAATDRLGLVAQDHESAWRRSFAGRLRAAAAIAHWAMRPGAVRLSLPLVRLFPHLLTWGARLSGKTTRIAPALG